MSNSVSMIGYGGEIVTEIISDAVDLAKTLLLDGYMVRVNGRAVDLYDDYVRRVVVWGNRDRKAGEPVNPDQQLGGW